MLRYWAAGATFWFAREGMVVFFCRYALIPLYPILLSCKLKELKIELFRIFVVTVELRKKIIVIIYCLSL